MYYFFVFFSADINYVCVDGQTGVCNLSWYLRMRPLRLPVKFIDVKLLVENHLNSAFYTYSVMPNYDDKVSINYHALPMYIILSNACLCVEFTLDICRDA